MPSVGYEGEGGVQGSLTCQSSIKGPLLKKYFWSRDIISGLGNGLTFQLVQVNARPMDHPGREAHLNPC